MIKKIQVFGLTIWLTDEDRLMRDGDIEAWLSEELGWWDRFGNVWIWIGDELKWYERVGIGIHELVEYVLEEKLSLSHEKAHKIANRVERILTLGKSRIY